MARRRWFISLFVLIAAAALGLIWLFVVPRAPLHEAAYRGDIEAINRLASKHPDQLNKCAGFHFINISIYILTPLMWAVEGEQDQAVDQLLRLGADVNAVDQFGRTALDLAIEHEDISTARKLLDAGAIANADQAADTPLTAAIRMRQDDMIELLLKYDAEKGQEDLVIFTSATYGSADAVRLLLSHIKPSLSDLRSLRERAGKRSDAEGKRVVEVLLEHAEALREAHKSDGESAG